MVTADVRLDLAHDHAHHGPQGEQVLSNNECFDDTGEIAESAF